MVVSKTTSEITAARFESALNQSRFESFSEWQRASGVSRSAFFYAKYGTFIPMADTAIKIARAAGTSVEAIWGHLADVQKKSPDGSSRQRTKKPTINHERKPATDIEP